MSMERADTGHPAEMIGLSEAVLGDAEKAALCRVIDSGWISSGEEVRLLEREFAAAHGQDDAAAVSSCTAALHLALAALGVRPGDEVLVPAVTFVATVNAALHVGGVSVPVDAVSPTCPHMSLDDAERCITPRTRAAVIMHYAGFPMDISAWAGFCRKRGLLLVEDAAHAPLLPEAGRHGDAAAFSFFANKNMTCAEGGVQTSIHYPPWHRFAWHSRHVAAPSLPAAEEFARRTLSLPLHPRLAEDDARAVVAALAASLKE